MSPPSWTSLPPLILSHPCRLLPEPWFEFSEAYRKFPLTVCFTYGSVYASITFSICLTFFFLPTIHAHKCVLYVCISIAALQIISTIFLDSIYVIIYDIFYVSDIVLY